MRVDSHQHFWKYNPVRDAWITDEMKILKADFLPTDLWPVLERNRIDGCVAVQADQSTDETSFLIELAKQHTFVRGVVGWIDLRAADLEHQLERYSVEPLLKGFRHIVQSEPKGFLLDMKFIEGVRKLAEWNFTYDLLIYHHQLGEAIHFLNKTDNVRIVVDHMAKPSIRTGEKTQWESDMASVSAFPNVCCKVSGLVTEAEWSGWTREQIFPYLDEILESFGPSRMMYGSDWPVCLLAAGYEEQMGIVTDYISALSAAERDRIMGGTAEEFYNL